VGKYSVESQLIALGYVLGQIGETEHANKVLLTANSNLPRDDPFCLRWLIELGKAFYSIKNYDLAFDSFSKVLENTDSQYEYALVASCLMKYWEWKGALYVISRITKNVSTRFFLCKQIFNKITTTSITSFKEGQTGKRTNTITDIISLIKLVGKLNHPVDKLHALAGFFEGIFIPRSLTLSDTGADEETLDDFGLLSSVVSDKLDQSEPLWSGMKLLNVVSNGNLQ